MVSEPVVWDSDGVNWEDFDGCLIRSVWDYHLKYVDFVDWAERVSNLIPVWNPADLMVWNSQKTYLDRLAARGVPTIPTAWVPRGSKTRLSDLLDENGWADAVIKPTIDLGAMSLRRVRDRRGIDQIAFESLLAHHDVMVQPFFDSVEDAGETSLIYLGGELSHVVRKRPKPGDFRVQPGWGGTSEATSACTDEIAVAQQVLAAIEQVMLYARVDLLRGPDGEPRLIELELLDPHLFLHERPGAADDLAAALGALVTG